MIDSCGTVSSRNIPAEKVIRTRNLILILFSAIITLTPDFGFIIPKSIHLSILLLWYIDVFWGEKKRIKGNLKLFILIVYLWFGYELILNNIGIGHAEIGNYLIRFCYFDIIIKAIYIKEEYDASQKKILFRLLQVVVILNIIYIKVLYTQFPDIYDTSSIDPEVLIGFNRPTAVFYNMLAFFIGLCFFDYLRGNNKRDKILDVASIIGAYSFKLTCQPRATSLAFSLILIFCAIYAFNKLSIRALFLLILCAPLIIGTLYLQRDQIIDILPDRIAIRYLAVLGENGGDESTLGRIPLMINSFSTFISHPFLGIGNYIGEQYYSIIGQHSIIPDFLAAYGIIGLIFLCFLFQEIYKQLFKFSSCVEVKRYGIGIFLTYIIYSFNSNTFYAQLAVSTFLMFACINIQKQHLRK